MEQLRWFVDLTTLENSLRARVFSLKRTQSICREDIKRDFRLKHGFCLLKRRHVGRLSIVLAAKIRST